jgi:hypothetical protein
VLCWLGIYSVLRLGWPQLALPCLQGGDVVTPQSVSVIVYDAVTLLLASPMSNDDAVLCAWCYLLAHTAGPVCTSRAAGACRLVVDFVI